MRSPTRQSGLTLVEMMVVLLIAGMALTLGFQSLGQWRRADAAISGLTGQARQLALTRSWLEESLRSLTPVEPAVPGTLSLGSRSEDSGMFEGARDRLSGLSLNGVLSARGGSTPVTWQVTTDADGTRLGLTENGQALELPLPEIGEAYFSYLDKEGRAHSQWPPALGLADQLPASVALHLVGTDGQQRVWAAPVVGILNPIPRPYEFDDDE